MRPLAAGPNLGYDSQLPPPRLRATVLYFEYERTETHWNHHGRESPLGKAARPKYR